MAFNDFLRSVHSQYAFCVSAEQMGVCGVRTVRAMMHVLCVDSANAFDVPDSHEWIVSAGI